MKTIEPTTGLQAGTMMVQEGLLLPNGLGIETCAYSKEWRTMETVDSFNLERKLAAMGWHLFFVAGQLTTTAFGRGGEASLRRAVKRLAAKVRALNLNCLQLTDIVPRHFLGVPYVVISVHPYHIQQGWQLQTTNERQGSQCDADWARK